ncbi:unnamed protein product [Miscanthus lutarioriparius]|uniref:Pentatricopeptide repeat-containing protein n=1 Tax=Miscanthus lutarioriparius TaxID=422564 RepID=A0A811SFM0_9POAL|nr:unnamed protein product [Miscanthus lutarioriparius]
MCAYLRAGRLADARDVFDRMPARDAASYSALISGHARLAGGSGSATAASAELLGRMRLADGLLPTEYTFVGLLTACARRGNPRLGTQVHALAAKSGHASSLLVANALLGMYVKCGRFGDVMRAFDGMDHRDVSSWNAVLAGLVELGRHEEAFELFGEMRASGDVCADRFTLSALLTTAGQGFGQPQGEAVHALSLKSGLETDLSVGNALIGGSTRSMGPLLRMWNFVTYNAVPTGFCRKKEGVRVTFAKKAGLRGLGLFRQMVEDGLEISDVTVTGVLNVCAIAADRKASEQVHAFVIKCGCMSSPWIDAVLIDMCIKCGRSGDAHLLFEQWQHEESFHIAWNSLLLASVRDGEYEKTFSTFLQMFRSSGVEFIDEFMLTAVLGVCGSLGFAELGKQLHSFAAKSGLLCARGVGNAFISMYGKCGELKDAANFFERMTCRDLVSWNAMVTAHLLLHQGDEILKIWSEMERLMIRPDSITFLLVISACSHTSSDSTEKCRELFLSMRSTYGIEPAMEHYAAFVYVLGCWGHFQGGTPLRTQGYRCVKRVCARSQQGAGRFTATWSIHFSRRDRAHPQSRDISPGLDVLILECIKDGYEPDTTFVLHDVEEYQKRHFLMYHSVKLSVNVWPSDGRPWTDRPCGEEHPHVRDCHSFLEHASAATGKVISVPNAFTRKYFSEYKGQHPVPVCTSSGACLTKAIGEVAIGQAFPQPSRSRPLDEGLLAER